MVHIIRERATDEQIREMLEALQTYIKLAVDVRRKVIAGGGGMHAECEAVLLEDGSQQTDIWGAAWTPESQEVQFESLINIRPKQHNRSMRIEDGGLRATIERIVRQRMQG
jgi:hypothetical protein